MKKKNIILIAFVCLILILSAVFFTLYGFYKVEIYPYEKKVKLIRKVDNPNIFMGKINPSASSFLNNQDLVLYKNPVNFDMKFSEKQTMCARMMGKPGDTVLISNSRVYINSELITEDYNLYFKYRVTTSDVVTDFEEMLKGNYVEILDVLGTGNAFEIIADQYQAEEILKIYDVESVRKVIKTLGVYEYGLFPSSTVVPWNPDNFGPLSIPQKGTTVVLNFKNMSFYKYIIDIYEENDLYYDRNKIEINGKITTHYTFKNNYYFVLNDNRTNYEDSRRWGFIPEDHIIGEIIK